MTWDPESASIQAESEIERDPNADQKVLIHPGSECIYFTSGAQIGKIEVPSLRTLFKVESGHKGAIIDFVVSSYNQIITTS